MTKYSEERIQDTVAHGQKNQRTAERIQNWCRNARISRFGGIGLVEQMTGVPIGHMGVECDHAPTGGMQSWDLEDAAIDFYVRNCEHCDKRTPGVGPDIEPLIQVYKEDETARAKEHAKRQELEAQRRSERKRELDKLRATGSQETNQIADLIDAIEKDENGSPADKLVEFARLAPETFSATIIQFLTEQFLASNSKLVTPALRTLLALPIDPDTKRELAVNDASGHSVHESSAAYLEKAAVELSVKDVNAVLHSVTLLAFPRSSLGYKPRQPNTAPLLAIASHHGEVVKKKLKEWLRSGKEPLVETALRAIWIITPQHPTLVRPFLRDVLGKLLRHKLLLPSFGDDGWEESLSILRRAAASLFRVFPDDADELLQSFLECADKTARSESAELYTGVLGKRWNQADLTLGRAQDIAFNRVLWMAVETPDDSPHNPAMLYFSRFDTKLLPIAAKHLDGMFGAACTLSSKMESLDKDRIVETPETGLEEIEKTQKRRSIRSLQGNLVSWVYTVSASQGCNGVNQILAMYTALPEAQVEMRANMVEHLSKLMGKPEYVNLVLPHLYSAMTSPEVSLRGSAARAIGEVPYELMRDFPELLFEVYMVLLTDPYVYVHKSAVYALKTHGFPENLKQQLTHCLINLILVYKFNGKDGNFVVECLKHYVRGCLTDTQLSGLEGRFVVQTIGQLDDMNAYEAIKSLGHLLKDVPDFVNLCAKCLQREWIHEISSEESMFQLLDRMPRKHLREAVGEIVDAAQSFADIRPHLAGPLIVLLAKAGCWAEAVHVCQHMLTVVPETRRDLGMRLYFESLRQVCAFESARPTGGISISEAEASWSILLKNIQDNDADRDARQSFPPIFFS